MISGEDCLALCGLTEREVAAIAEHEHVPEIAAAALANSLLQKSGGEKEIRRMLIDDIHAALEEKRVRHATELFVALRQFLYRYPRATEDLVSY